MSNWRMNSLGLGLFLAAFLSSPLTVFADETEKNDDWNFKVGLGAAYTSDYEGSDDYEVMALPLLEVSWRDIVTVGTMGGPKIGVKVLNVKGPTPQDRLSVTTSLGYYMGREADDNDALKGLGDIDGNMTAGLDLEYGFQQFQFKTGLEQDISGDRDGTVVSAEINYITTFGLKDTRFIFGTELSWASDDYMQNTFGISSSQATSSALGYSTYNAGAGIKDAGLKAIVMKQFTENVSLMGMVGYSQLMGDAADSPLVKDQGDEKQLKTMLGLIYSW